MRVIENINSVIRFIGYLTPLLLLVFSKGIIFDYINKLRWYHQDLWKIILKIGYFGLILIAALFAFVAIYKLFSFSNKTRYNYCNKQLTVESKLRIAKLAESDHQIEEYFIANSEWLETDIANFIEMYAREISKVDFNDFKQFVNDRAIIYFAHRVTQRNKFLEILNRL